MQIATPLVLTHPTNSGALLMELLSLAEEGKRKNSHAIDVSSVISLGLLRRFLSALTFRDRTTMFHVRRTALVAQGIATRLGWEDRQLRVLEIAALLHDLGKVAVPDHILNKPGKLTPDESEFIATQHRVVLGVLQACLVDSEVIQIISFAHGLESKESHDRGPTQGARILAVADAFDSLTHSQPFRQAYSRPDAVRILQEQSGKQFDRNVVVALERWLDSVDSHVLNDDRSAEEAINPDALIDPETIRDGSLFWNLCSYLYVLECMYDGYYIVNSGLDIAVWNPGAAKLFGRSTKSIQGQLWSRTALFSDGIQTGADPLHVAMRTKRSFCSRMSIVDGNQNTHQLDVQTFPIVNSLGEVKGVVELFCDDTTAKQGRGQFRQLQHEATRDALTGVLNRGKLEKEAKELFSEHQRSGKPLSFIFLDLDHFKAINDRWSHAVGDKVLVEVARLLQDELYSGEVVGRYGGEEFVVLCPETPLSQAVERAERLRRLVMDVEFADFRVTASFGVAELEDGDSLDTLRKRADEALYDAKRGGRNRTCFRQRLAKPSSNPKLVLPGAAEKGKHRTSFNTCLTSELLTIKLKGYIEDQKARLRTVQPDKLTFQVGSPPLFGGWGNTQAKQPVLVTIEIVTAQDVHGRAAAKKHQMQVLIEPIGAYPSEAVFERRALFVIESLRSYTMAD